MQYSFAWILLSVLFSNNAIAQTITLTSQEKFWVDANNCNNSGPQGAWMSFTVLNNTGSTINNVEITFNKFTGTNSTWFIAPTDSIRNFTSISNNQKVPVYFYVDYSEVCNHSQGGGTPYSGYTANYSVKVNSTGNSTVTRSSSIQTGDLITANSAGIATSCSLSASSIHIGQSFNETVTYSYGNNSDLFMQPNSEKNFEESKLRLIGSEVTSTSGGVSNILGTKDSLWYPNASVPGGGGTITVKYTWLCIGLNNAVTIHPWAAAKSGNRYKYEGMGSTTIIPAATSGITLTKIADPDYMNSSTSDVGFGAGISQWKIGLTNTTNTDLLVCKVYDSIPSCMTISTPLTPSSDITSGMSAYTPSLGSTGYVHWDGIQSNSSAIYEYLIPANTTYYLIYRTNNSACPYPANYINDAYYSIGTYFSSSVQDTLTISCVAPDISYSASSYCQSGTASVTLSGNAGGNYSSTPSGLSLNSSTGLINLAGSTAGTYWVKYTVTVHSCTSSDSFQVTILPSPSISISSTNVLCYGNASGSATATPSGATSPYTYSWNTSPVQTTSTISSLIAGSYTVTVTDHNGCVNSSNVTITQPSAALSASIGSQTNVLCYGNSTGSVTISASGGTTAYQYKLDAGAYQSSATFSSLAAGSYVVTVKDANNCTTTQNVTITQPSAALIASIGSQTNVLCYGNSTGSVTISASGGTTAYQYKLDAGAYQSSATFSSLAAGSYVVTVKDANNCTTTLNVTITQPSAALSASIGSQTNVLCYGNSTGSVTISASGGTTAYQYKLDAGAYQSSATFSNLAAGSYVVTVKDANNCTTTQNVTITQPSAALSASIGSQANVLCYGNSTGSVTISASGGTTAYQYKLDAGAFQTSATFSSLAAGSYIVTVKDANNCTVTQNVTITQPSSSLTSSLVSQTNVLCYGYSTGAIDISVSGGTSAYTYNWLKNGSSYASSQDLTNLTAATYSVTITDANSCTTNRSVTITQPNQVSISNVSHTNISCYGNSNGAIDISVSGGTGSYTYAWTRNTLPSYSATTQDLGNVISGTYYVIVSDSFSCHGYDTVTLTEPTVLSIQTDSITGLACSDQTTGSIEITVNGGTTPYTYNWTKSGVPSFHQTTQDIYALGVGTYTGIVTDANGCTDTITATLVSGLVQANFTLVQSDCDGNYTITNNSVGATEYVWDIQGTSPTQTTRSVYCTSSDTVFVSAFEPGSYTVILTAKNELGCMDTMIKTLTVMPHPIAVFAYEKVACTGTVNFTNLTINGVSSLWSFGDPGSGINNTSTLANPSHTYSSNSTYNVTLIASDGAGCSDTLTRSIQVNPVGSLPNAAFNYSINTSSCVTKVNFTNNSSNYTGNLWIFHDGNSNNLVNTSKTYPLAGNYEVKLVAYSANGCTDTATQTITISSNSYGTIAKFAVDDTLQCLYNNRFNFINQSLYYGPNWVSNYYWDFGDTTTNNINTFVYNKVYSSAGTYTVRLVAVSPSGCRDTAYQTLRVLPSADPTFIMTIGCSQTAILEHTVDTNVTYVWSFGDGTYSTNKLDSFSHYFSVPGVYPITLTTYMDNGCSDSYTIGTLASDGRSPIANFNYYVACGDNIQFENLSSWGSSFIWDFGDGSPADSSYAPYHSYPAAGTYNVTLTVYNSPTCITHITIPITAPQGHGIKLPRAFMSYYVIPCTNTIIASDSSSIDAGIYHWYLNDIYQGTDSVLAISTSGPGFYHLKMIADNGSCQDTASMGVEIQEAPVASFELTSNVCSNNVLVTSTSSHATSYDWEFGDLGSPTNLTHGANSSHAYSENGTYQIRLIAYNLNQCADTIVQTANLTHFNSYSAANYWYDGGLCNCRCSNAVAFHNLTHGTSNVYLWDFGDGTSSVQENPTKGFPSAGTYPVTLTAVDSSGCISTKTMNVTIDASASGTSASFTTDHQVQCIDSNSFNFYNTSVFMGTDWVNKYYWYFGDGTMDSTNTFIYNKHYTTVGNYAVTLVAVGTLGCRDTMTMYIQVRDLPCTGVMPKIILNDGSNWHVGPVFKPKKTTGLNENELANITIYPNPSNGQYEIQLPLDVKEKVLIEVFDLTGRLVYSTHSIVSPDNTTLILDITNLEQGNYMLNVKSASIQFKTKQISKIE